MNDSKISVRYAKALFLLAQEKNKLSEIKNDLSGIIDICTKIPEFGYILENPSITTTEKTNIFKQIFSEKITDITNNFIALLCEKKREIYLPQIARNYIKLYRESMNIREVMITTVNTLDSVTKNKVEDVLKMYLKANVELQQKTDTAIIGGFIIKIDDTQIDSSVSTKLSKIKRTLIN